MPAPKGHPRYGGRTKGTQNKATIERELRAQQALERANAQGIELARDVMQRAMVLAEGATGLHRPIAPAELLKAQEQENALAQAEGRAPRKIIAGGDWKLFGEWYDRWFDAARELAKYQSPQIKAVDAPTPPPDPNKQAPVRRFGLRVFEGGRSLSPATGDDEAA